MTTPESIRVLHVDDEPEVAELTAEMLEREDDRFTVETATSPSEGLNRLADHEFECIVSDYDMPGMDGIEFLKRVREEYPDLPFLLFTGKGSEEIATEAISAGVTHYTQKRPGTDQYELLANRVKNAVEQYRSQRRVARQRQEYQQLFEQAPVMFAIFRNDDGEPIFEDCNDRFAEKLGYDPDTLRGRSMREFYTEESVQQAIEGDGFQRALGGELTTEERTLRTNNGDTRDVLVRAAPRTDATGAVTGTLALYIDITERKQREQELKRQQRETQRLQNLLQRALGVTDTYVWEWDLETDEIDRYPTVEHLFGISAQALGDIDTFVEHVHPEDRNHIEEAMRAGVESGEGYQLEYRVQTADGSWRWVRDRSDVITDDRGTPVRAVGSITDISEAKAREQELRVVLDRYEALFANTNDAIARIEYEDGIPIIQEANEAFRELFEPPGEDVVGRDLDEIVASDDRFEEAREYSRRTSDGQFMSAELTRDTVDGPRDFRWQAVPLEESSDPEDGLDAYAVYTDITERKEHERELEQYRTLVESVGDPMYMLDAEGNITMVNEAVVEQWGYDRDELLSMHASDVMPDEDYRRGTDLIVELLEDDDRSWGSFEMRSITADGEILENENKIGVITDDGEYVATVGVIRDITERKQRERELNRQREQLEQRQEKLLWLRDYTQELMYAETDEETATVALRAVDEILGFELGAVFTQSETQEGVLELVEVLNRSRMEKMYGGLPAFVRDAPSGTHSALAWEVFETGESVFLNDTAESERLTRKSPFGSLMLYPIGQHGIILLAATRLEAFTETEELLLDLLATALETAFDRLEREQDLRSQRDELERQNERLEQFASVVSHDLRNPLKVATARLELASEECESTHLADVGTALDRMDALIEDLLTVAREGKQVQTAEAVSLSEIGEQCWATVTTDAGTLRVKTEQTIKADPGRLKQLLENLMRNAVEHGGQDVSITIGDLSEGFYVADDGPGIPEDDRDAVFEVGYTTTEDGTGFGLAIVQEIADAHDWEVRLTESDAGGARFEITGVEING